MVWLLPKLTSLIIKELIISKVHEDAHLEHVSGRKSSLFKGGHIETCFFWRHQYRSHWRICCQEYLTAELCIIFCSLCWDPWTSTALWTYAKDRLDHKILQQGIKQTISNLFNLSRCTCTLPIKTFLEVLSIRCPLSKTIGMRFKSDN